MRYLDDQLSPDSSPQRDPRQLALLAKAARAAQQDRQNSAFLDQSLSAAPANAGHQMLSPGTLFPTQEQLGTTLPMGGSGAAELATRIFGQPVGDTRDFAELAARAARARNMASGEGIQNTATLQSGLRGQTGLDGGIAPAELAARAARILNEQAVPHDRSRVDATPWVKAPSRIPRPAAGPDVKPNLRINDPKQSRATLGRLMQGIREFPIPRVERHFAPADDEKAANLAYSETTRGTVREHEAIISVILNRLRDPQRRQYVDRGQEYTVDNVIHAHGRHGIHQFQGIDNEVYKGFKDRHDQGAQNARMAAANIAAHGPTNSATAFLVMPPGKKPNKQQVGNLGHVDFVGREGNVFLYGPKPADLQTRSHKVPGHQPSSDHQRRR